MTSLPSVQGSQPSQLAMSQAVIRLPGGNQDEHETAHKEPRGSQPRRAQKTQTQINTRETKQRTVVGARRSGVWDGEKAVWEFKGRKDQFQLGIQKAFMKEMAHGKTTHQDTRRPKFQSLFDHCWPRKLEKARSLF